MKHLGIVILIILIIVAIEGFAQGSAHKFYKTQNWTYVWGATLGYFFIVLLLSKADSYIPFSSVNAVWSSLSVISVALIACFFYGEKISQKQWFSFGFITIGLVILLFNGGVNGHENIPTVE
jgi:drug/metabolite transporter (DMT)-like permease